MLTTQEEKRILKKILTVNKEIAAKKADLDACYNLKFDLFNELFACRWNQGERNIEKLTEAST